MYVNGTKTHDIEKVVVGSPGEKSLNTEAEILTTKAMIIFLVWILRVLPLSDTISVSTKQGTGCG